MKICPYCEASIANNAKKCKHCWETVKQIRLCPYCEAEVSETAKKCKHCWERLDESISSQNNNLRSNTSWFKWRTDRTWFLCVYISLCLLGILGCLIYYLWEQSYNHIYDGPTDRAISAFVSLSTFIFAIPWRIRRFHDTWQSGRNVLRWIILIPIRWLIDLYLLIRPWEKKSNKYWDIPWGYSTNMNLGLVCFYVIITILIVQLRKKIG